MKPVMLWRWSLVLSVQLGAAGPSHDSWFGADKLMHFAMGTFAESVGYGTVRAFGGTNRAATVGGLLATAGAGVGKELRDRSVQGDVSGKDLVWTLAGGGAMQVLLSQTRR